VEVFYRPRLLVHGRLLRVAVIALGSAPFCVDYPTGSPGCATAPRDDLVTRAQLRARTQAAP
jgi:hypothetical protein